MNAIARPAASAAAFAPKELAQRLFDELRRATSDRVGVTRQSYGPGEQKAMELVKAVAEQHRLATSWDAAANLVVSLEGREPAKPAIICGSHLDSVPQGGNFDGAAGVVGSRVGRATLILKRCRSLGNEYRICIPPRSNLVIFSGPPERLTH